MCKVLIGLALSFCLLPVTAWATDRYYSDITEHSPSKRFRIEAKSPDNAVEGHKAFQKDFVYTFTDTKTGKVIWTHKQKGSRRTRVLVEGSPMRIDVSDDGWTTVWTGGHSLIAFNPDGEVTTWIDLLDEAMTGEERQKHVARTTAGPMWAGLSHWYFAEIGNGKAYVVRPWWGRRMFFNLETGELFEPDDELRGIAVELETKHAFATLQKFKQTDHKLDSWDFRLATHLAGCLKLKAAQPLLEEVEKSEYVGSSVFGRFEYEVLSLRQVSQLALRRIGAAPAQSPPIHIDNLEGSAGKRSNWADVKPGMSPDEVYQLIGAPDFMPRDVWSYDLQGDDPLTFEVKWDRAKIVVSAERLKPKWNNGISRDELVK